MRILMLWHCVFSVVMLNAAHLEIGETTQDEAVALAIDEGLTQDRYLSLCYGESAQKMLDAAYEARGTNFIEGAAFVRNKSNGDIRNVPCIEPGSKLGSYMQFMKRNRSAILKPSDVVPVSGRMFGQPDAFNSLVSLMTKKINKHIVFSGEGKHTFRDVFDPSAQSYSFWPLGCAIHKASDYAEEVAHFFNFKDPRQPPRSFKGEWSSPDYAKVVKWNEFLAAYRGVKVYAFSIGFNLNDAPIDENPVFDIFFTAIQDEVMQWKESNSRPMATNAYILLCAFFEAKAAEGTDADNSAYRRLRELCRNNSVSAMIL